MAFSLEVSGGFAEVQRLLASIPADIQARLQRAYGVAIRAAVRDATRAVVAAYPRVTGRLRQSLAVVARLQRRQGYSAHYRVSLVVSFPGATYHNRVLQHRQHRHLDGFVNRWMDRNLVGYVNRAIAREFA